jgi:hypothetical protein
MQAGDGDVRDGACSDGNKMDGDEIRWGSIDLKMGRSVLNNYDGNMVIQIKCSKYFT